MQKCPVIFLAFANDHQDYLYKLTEEQNVIRRALKQMEKQGLCKVVYETDTDLDKIWQTFNEYQDRITVFHYGGHAEDYALLLKKANGERQFANGEGLVSFLARQKGLQLVFINGCSSKRQAEELRDKGVPAVVGTSEPINDEVATILSGEFYRSLASGRSLEQAWLSAKDLVRSQKKEEGYYRGIGSQKSNTKYVKDFPWELYIRPGAETVKEWNLPRAARSPLFGLSLPKEAFRHLPQAPYVGLHYFQEKDAAVFFGRGVQIRELHNHLEGIHPIILLYGKSGVGKSSMLDAGLAPRIRDKYEISYLRRDAGKGLLGTLDQALNQLLEKLPVGPKPEEVDTHSEEMRQLLNLAAKKATDKQIRLQIEALVQQLASTSMQELSELTDLLKKWQQIEQKVRKPLVIILDQVEEKFTRPKRGIEKAQQDELLELLTAIQPLFSHSNSGIQGKMILSYRKEYHPEIRDAFHTLALPYAELFLKRLDRDGIIEAARGVSLHDKVKNGKIRHNTQHNPYRLELEQSANGNLAEIIADDLMEDLESPIAPVLQITLQKLWQIAEKKDGQPVRISIKQYRELRKLGTSMGEFFQQQVEKLSTGTEEGWDEETRKKISAAIQSGLILDILYAHTTELGTADSCKRNDLLQRYDVKEPIIKMFLDKLQTLSLLNRSEVSLEEGEENYTYYLAHDTLAPAVILAYNLSNAPGQRAARILKHRMSDIGFTVAAATLKGWKVDKEDTLALKKEHIGLNKFLAVVREVLGPKRFNEQKAQLIAKVKLNFKSGENEVLLEEADLLMVEIGAGKKGDGFPGMPKLSRPAKELLKNSQAWRKRRTAAVLKAQKEKEQLIQQRLQAFEEVKAQKTKVDFTLELAEKSRKVSATIIAKVLITDETYFHEKPEILSIGEYDKFVSPTEIKDYLKEWHTGMWGIEGRLRGLKFRDDLSWIAPQEIRVDQHAILYLQLFLVDSGLLQPNAISGIFGYETLSAVRQFQEINFVKGGENSLPDGKVGAKTWKTVLKWKAEELKSDYNSFSNIFPSKTYSKWLDLLQKVQAHYTEQPNEAHQQINGLEKTGDTRKVAGWSTSEEHIHLLCIRRNADKDDKHKRPDDLFVLLIKGQAFIFWGSTDPSIRLASRSDEAYLAAGQHQFQFGWHKLSNRAKVYRAIRPKAEGVMVFRDKQNVDALTAENIKTGLDKKPNPTITISWSGIGRSNWSGGNLVIAGKSYLNYQGKIVDCTSFAAIGNRDLKEVSKTQGAFNSLLDLITILSDSPDPDILVTLINEDDLHLSQSIPDNYAETLLIRLNGEKAAAVKP